MDLGMKNIDSLSTIEKISLYNCLYKDLAGKGIDGDTELAHVNKEEMEVLRSMGGSGTINPHTNLIQFGGGGKQRQPTQTTQTQQTTFPKELQPFISDIFGKAQAIQEKRETEGYVPFQGPRLADFTEDQQVAFQGVRDTVGQGEPFFTRATELTESATAAPTSESVGQFMNPYIQNVLDIEKREARRQSDVAGQQIAGRAARAGGFGGSREAILSAENERNTQRNLADIQSRGLASAFEDAQSRLAQQRQRELSAGQQFSGLGAALPAQRLREFGALEATGATQQQRGQQALDIAQQEFEIGRTFPERTLGDYSAILRGFTQPLAGSTFRQGSTRTPGPSFGQQAAGVAGLVGTANRAGFFGNNNNRSFFGNNREGGLVGLANGGKVARYGNGTGPYTLAGENKQQIEERLGMSPRERLALHKNREAAKLAQIKQAAKADRKDVTDVERGAEKTVNSPEDLKNLLSGFSYADQTAADFQKLLAGHEAISKSRKGMLDTKRELLQKQIADAEGAGQDELYAGLLRYAAADPVKGIQGLFEAFEESPENLKKEEKRAADLALTEAGLDLEGEEAAIKDIQGRITLSTAIQKAIEARQVGMTEAIQMKKLVELGVDPKDLQKYNIRISPDKLKVYESLWKAGTNPIKTTGVSNAPSAKQAAQSIDSVQITAEGE
jgi:hypothetical protein